MNTIRQDDVIESVAGALQFRDRFMYYVGPVDPVRDEVAGPAGPTTASRIDNCTEMMLGQTGLLRMIGKAERDPDAIEAIKRHKGGFTLSRPAARLTRPRRRSVHRVFMLPPSSEWRRLTNSMCRTCR